MPTRADQIAAALLHLPGADPILGDLIQRVGPFTLKLHRDRYEILVRSILSQQISTKAARAIRLKLQAATATNRITPENIDALTEVQLRAAGLSGQKVAYLRDLTDAVRSQRIRLDRIGRKSDEDVIAELIQVKGIGEWTAQMFLMFSLGRMDVFPHGDLGLRASLKELYRLEELPGKAASLQLAQPWRPFASVATWYAWRLADLKNDPTMDASRYPV